MSSHQANETIHMQPHSGVLQMTGHNDSHYIFPAPLPYSPQFQTCQGDKCILSASFTVLDCLKGSSCMLTHVHVKWTLQQSLMHIGRW